MTILLAIKTGAAQHNLGAGCFTPSAQMRIVSTAAAAQATAATGQRRPCPLSATDSRAATFGHFHGDAGCFLEKQPKLHPAPSRSNNSRFFAESLGTFRISRTRGPPPTLLAASIPRKSRL